MKNIAVITGASSGMGREFVKTASNFGQTFDEVWVIARREDRLKELTCQFPVKCIPMDLTDRNNFKKYEEMLKSENDACGGLNVLLLINASGFGKFESTRNISMETSLNMVDLNCQALQAMCLMTLPYMKKGSGIINIASIAALQPVPYINVYAASKAFVLSYTRALYSELKKEGIRVLALCPYWTKTGFFDVAVKDDKNPVVKKYVAMYETEDVVQRAWNYLKKGKDVAFYGFISRAQAGLCKILPHSLVMKIWMKQQKLK